MGIKTRFNPMGGPSGIEEIPSAWSYVTEANGVRTLWYYNNTIGGDIVRVPKGKTQLQDYQTTTSPINASRLRLPFYEHNTLTHIDLRGVVFTRKSMSDAFRNCTNLVSVSGISHDTIFMNNTFYNCRHLTSAQISNNAVWIENTFRLCTNLNQNIQIPNGISTMNYTFAGCSSLNQNIQIPNSVTTLYHAFSSCSKLNQNIKIPNGITSINAAFASCYNLNQNIQIPNGVTDVTNAFEYCTNLNQNIRIPNSVTDMTRMFFSCRALNQNIQIPNSVTDATAAFYDCSNLTQNIQIPNSVTDMSSAFRECSSLNQNIRIPNSVTNMRYTFDTCVSLNQNIQIPNSVTNMTYTFHYCRNLTQNIRIPNSVTEIAHIFSDCYNIGSNSKTITIASANILNCTDSFKFTSINNMSNQLTVVFPMRYINNVNTLTRNSLVTAGYAVGTGLGITAANATENRNLLCWDMIPYQGYNTYTGNGTHWQLTKWNGRSGALGTSVTVPKSITTYGTFPTGITNATFTANHEITSVNVNNVPITNFAQAFRNCWNLTRVTNISLQTDQTSTYYMYYNCQNLVSVPYIPNSITNAYAMYGYCKSMNNIYFNSFNITQMAYACDYCNTQDINVYIKSPEVTGITNMFRGNAKTQRKNVYIYFKYANGVATKTFNVFKPALYTGTTGNSGTVSPMYNSTSGFYIYNLGTCPI